jgi:hypothetical protein
MPLKTSRLYQRKGCLAENWKRLWNTYLRTNESECVAVVLGLCSKRLKRADADQFELGVDANCHNSIVGRFARTITDPASNSNRL